MRTERAVRRQLSRVRYELRHQKKPNLWRTMELQIYETIFLWVLKDKSVKATKGTV